MITQKIIIKDNGWDNFKKETKKLQKAKIEIGLWGSGNPENNLASRGFVHEYGVQIKITPKMRKFLHVIGIHVSANTAFIEIPSRPFMRNAFDNGQRILKKFIEKKYKEMIKSNITPAQFFKQIGIFHVAQIKTSIKTGNYARLHPVTINRKGSSKSLIDTGAMLNGVKYKLKVKF